MADHIEPRQPAESWLEIRLRHRLTGPAGPFELAVDLAIEEGSFVLLTGPSGAGKTTLLRCLAGFERAASGFVRVKDRVWSDPAARLWLPVQKRPIGFVFQDYALFPNMSLRGNLDYALGRKAPAGEALRLLELVDLAGLASAFPAELSGGQKQRLALVRALARRPELLMLDEPLSALDPELRARLQEELLRLHAAFGTTTLMISHDPLEIARLADRILRLENGVIVSDRSGARALPGGGPTQLTHLSGPDDRGLCRALLGAQVIELRYPVPPEGLQPGTPLAIHPPGQQG